MVYAFAFNYTLPVSLIVGFYLQVLHSTNCLVKYFSHSNSQIVKAVVAHEAALRAQAKKMNVDSLRSNAKENEDSAEVKIAKVIY